MLWIAERGRVWLPHRVVCTDTQVEEYAMDDERVLLLKHAHSGDNMYLHCLDMWYETTVQAGDMVHVLTHTMMAGGEPCAAAGCSGNCGPHACDVVSKHRGLLIVHPDLLLSATTVGSSFQCLRRCVGGPLQQPCSDRTHTSTPKVGTRRANAPRSSLEGCATANRLAGG
jgi:hypothetical protein